jgi:hypothetical protein
MLCDVQGALVEGYTNKVPKVVVGALDATLLLIRYVKRPHREAAEAVLVSCPQRSATS